MVLAILIRGKLHLVELFDIIKTYYEKNTITYLKK